MSAKLAKKLASEVGEVYCRDRKSWRAWLIKNHDKVNSVWLVYDKIAKGGKLTYDDIVEEALCWGWIDSVMRSKDDLQSMQYMSRRKKGSTWSKPNKERVARLIKAGLMTEHGLQPIEAAKADGSWTALDAIENLEVPPDLQAALDKKKPAKRYFEALSASNKKQLLYHVQSAKREQTRRTRVDQIVAACAEQRNPLVRKD